MTKGGGGHLYTKIISVRQETQTLEHASRITLWYKVDEIILFFNEIRLIMIFSHFSQLFHSLAHTHTHTILLLTSFLFLFLSFLTFHSFYSLSLILSLSFLLLTRSRYLTQSFTHALYDNGYNNNCYRDIVKRKHINSRTRPFGEAFKCHALRARSFVRV